MQVHHAQGDAGGDLDGGEHECGRQRADPPLPLPGIGDRGGIRERDAQEHLGARAGTRPHLGPATDRFQ